MPDAAETLVTGVTVDSRDVVTGDLFGALPGLQVHGATFGGGPWRPERSAILTDARGRRAARRRRRHGAGARSPKQPRKAIGEAAALVYGDPSRDLVLVGVTGTNGKTTTSYFIDNALAAGARESRHPRHRRVARAR